ncbi:hypothetical protein acsn021_18090 [Anaerocolumna cellulosilytica]|uniref:Uncharacterized protein n=1 Tax=Anaerocolumna cellulosilytica TaxID=433286 RepID=A0A6S6R4B6_9FIRM|nr:hypothetical protein [Anaerocolumna cellulosilytica]MBB5194796.1 hypothetical protein [Anaerocolumna cellulosilytica]BCJ94240.1 hypothetical protein acsn021_18090 [Anaerocolumna cellulosilytica]
MKKNLRVLFMFTVGAIILFLLIFAFPIVMTAIFFTPYVKSALILLIFISIVLKNKLSWKNSVVFVVGIFSLVGMLMDTAGNPIYNKPLAVIVSSVGELNIESKTYNYAPGEYSITDYISIIKSEGEVVNLHIILLYLYRFVQYIILYSIVATLLGLLVRRMPDNKIPLVPVVEEVTPELNQRIQEEKRRREEEKKNRLTLSVEVKDTVIQLKKTENSIKAIKVIREHTDVSLAEAKKLLDELED